MLELDLYKAIVTDIEDKDKEGKVQVRILPNLNDVEKQDLPWAIPFNSNCSKNTLSNDLPQVDSTIRVLVDKTFKRFFYLPNMYFYGLWDFNKITQKMNNTKDVDKTYKNLKFRMYEDGGLEFHNNDDGSHGFIHSSGSQIYFDKNGNIVQSINSTQKITMKNDTTSLGSILKELMNDLSSLTTVGSPASHTSPQLTAQMQTLLPKLEMLLNCD